MSKTFNMIKSLLLVGAVVAATSGCDSAPKKDPTQKEAAVKQWNQARAGVMHSLATDQFKTGNFDKARATVDEAMGIDPDNVPLRILSAQISIEQNRLDLADKQLAEALKRDEKNAEALYLSGVVAQRWQKMEQALDYYVRASDAQPAELAYLLARAEMLVMLDRRPEAMSAVKDKLIYFEHSAALRDAVGQFYMNQRQYAEAADMFRQASVLASDDLGIRERLASAQFYSSDYPAAADTLGRLLATDAYRDRAELHIMLGESRLHLRQNVEARQSFTTATEVNPASVPAWIGLGKSALAMNDLRRADGAVRRVISLAPENADAHLMLGYLRMKQERFEDAIRAFESASRLDPTDSVGLCMIGHLYETRGNANEALHWYGKALQVNPRDTMALRMMATAQLGE